MRSFVDADNQPDNLYVKVSQNLDSPPTSILHDVRIFSAPTVPLVLLVELLEVNSFDQETRFRI